MELEHFNYSLTFLIKSSEQSVYGLNGFVQYSVCIFQTRNNGVNPVCTSFPLRHSSLYTSKDVSLKIGLHIHTLCVIKFRWLYWKVLPNKNLVSAVCIDFPAEGIVLKVSILGNDTISEGAMAYEL